MDSNNQVQIVEGIHNSQKVIWIIFDYDRSLINRLKAKFPKVRWSQSGKGWYLPNKNHYREMLGLPIVKTSYLESITAAINPINRPFLKKYIETLQLKAYSDNTIKTYVYEFSQLLRILKGYPADELKPERLRSYILYCINHLKLSENLIHSRLNAIKFFYEQVLHRERMFIEIPRPKKPSALPKILNTAEIKKIIDVTQNEKHLLILQLCYGMGLRVSEIVQLRIEDIDTERMRVHIIHAKGKVDRYVNLPSSLLPLLRSYYKQYLPKEYLFEGAGGGQYAIRSVQQVFKIAMQRVGIRKKIGIHSLRHSYATHLMEYGTDINDIKELLGHRDIKTTAIYTHVATTLEKIISPLDKLENT